MPLNDQLVETFSQLALQVYDADREGLDASARARLVDLAAAKLRPALQAATSEDLVHVVCALAFVPSHRRIL